MGVNKCRNGKRAIVELALGICNAVTAENAVMVLLSLVYCVVNLKTGEAVIISVATEVEK